MLFLIRTEQRLHTSLGVMCFAAICGINFVMISKLYHTILKLTSATLCRCVSNLNLDEETRFMLDGNCFNFGTQKHLKNLEGRQRNFRNKFQQSINFVTF